MATIMTALWKQALCSATSTNDSRTWRPALKNWPMIDPSLLRQLEATFQPSLKATMADALDPQLALRVAHMAGVNEVITKLKLIESKQRKERS